METFSTSNTRHDRAQLTPHLPDDHESDYEDHESGYLVINTTRNSNDSDHPRQPIILDLRAVDPYDIAQYLEDLKRKYGTVSVMDRDNKLHQVRRGYPDGRLIVANCHPYFIGEHLHVVLQCTACRSVFCENCSREAHRDRCEINVSQIACPWCGHDDHKEVEV